ncbi:MAG: hypothetical protein WAK26_16025 [Terracidiphilus sp.]
MFESVSLSDQARVFQCPNCKETIDTSAQQCRFCSAAIDPGAAEAAADAMARVNQACSDASYLKVMGVSVPIFLVLIFIPFAGWLGIVGYYFLIFATPVMALRWWMKFRRIATDDREFGRARRTVIIVGALVTLLLLNQLANLALMFLRTLQ